MDSRGPSRRDAEELEFSASPLPPLLPLLCFPLLPRNICPLSCLFVTMETHCARLGEEKVLRVIVTLEFNGPRLWFTRDPGWVSPANSLSLSLNRNLCPFLPPHLFHGVATTVYGVATTSCPLYLVFSPSYFLLARKYVRTFPERTNIWNITCVIGSVHIREVTKEFFRLIGHLFHNTI